MTFTPNPFTPATVTAVVLATFAFVPTTTAQQQPTTFRAGVTLAGVDVTVLDSDGRPVPGLTADDFQITLNGKRQPVRTLAYVEATEPSDAMAAVVLPTPDAGSRAYVTNTVPEEDPRVIVLTVDDLSFPAGEGRRTLLAARRFVERQPTNTLVGLTTTSGAVVVNPTRDGSVITTALGRVVGAFIDPRRTEGNETPTIGIAEALEIASYNNTSVQDAAIERECGRALDTNGTVMAIGQYNSKCATDLVQSARLMTSLVQGTAGRQVSALSNILNAMKDAPGLKQMIVLTQGVAGTRDLTSVFAPVVTSAAAAGVQISILMEDDEDLDMSRQERGRTALSQRIGGSNLADRRREDRRMFMAALQVLADSAGGTFERVISSPDGAFQRASVAGSAVYRLGVEVPPEAHSTKTLTVTAAVIRDGVTLHVNRHAFVPGTAGDLGTPGRVTAAIRNGTPYYAVPLRVGVAKRAVGDQIELGLDVAVPASVAGPLRITIGVLDAHGALKQGTQAIPKTNSPAGYRLMIPMPVAKGAYRVRLAVEDATGGVGSVDTEIDARLNAVGPLHASDVLTWWKDGSGHSQFLALDDIPSGVASLHAGIELYTIAGDTVPADLTVRLSIVAVGATAPIAQVDITPRVDGQLRRADAALPLASLAPGSYLIRAAVRSGDQLLGEVVTTIRRRPQL